METMNVSVYVSQSVSSHCLLSACQIAVEGCCHGELDKIYETVTFIEKTHNMKIDLLLCCGDFQVLIHQQ